MAWVVDTISDKSKETIITAIAVSAEAAATIVDASTLLGNAGAGTEVLDIAAISWNGSAAITLEFDATSNDPAMVLTGSGEIGWSDGIPMVRTNPKGSGYTGDIVATAAGSAIISVKLRKREGYS